MSEEEKARPIRQPIVSVLGHVDHGKTSILDNIRGTSVAAREAGLITQHIGATEVPVDSIVKMCGGKVTPEAVKLPGLLFIDTPGHHSFSTLRARGGALADLAILVVDIREGIKPQTIESLNLFKKNKTPFVIAANKIDRIDGWRTDKWSFFVENYRKQDPTIQARLDEKLYAFIGRLYEHGFAAERYDKISDFTQNIGIVPTCALSGEGIPDIVLTLVGLSQRYLEQRLHFEEDHVEGTVLELKEVKGLGTTLDVIIYNGVLRSNHQVVIPTKNGSMATGIKAILKPKPMDEIRDPKEAFNKVSEATAAVGVRLVPQETEGVIVGGIFRAVEADGVEEAIEYVERSAKVNVPLNKTGVVIKADAIGSLEAMAYELKREEIQIFRADVGTITKRDLMDASNMEDPLQRVVLGFGVKITGEVADDKECYEAKAFTSDIVYKLIEDYTDWKYARKKELDTDYRCNIVFPGKFRILPNHTFRVSKPAVVGVRVLGGRIRVGQKVIRNDGKPLGRIKSIRIKETNISEAKMGDEVAIAITEMIMGRNAKEEDLLFIDIPEADARDLKKYELTYEEEETLAEVAKLKKKINNKPYWGL